MKYTFSGLMAVLLILITAFSLTGCSDGSVQTRTDEISDFNQIQIGTFGEFIIQQGDEESLTIEAPRDYLRYITTEVDDGVLFIDTRRGFLGTPVRQVTYNITVKDLNEISLSGAGVIKIYELETDQLDLILTGAGSVEVDDLTAKSLDINLTSAGSIVVAGAV